MYDTKKKLIHQYEKEVITIVFLCECVDFA